MLDPAEIATAGAHRLVEQRQGTVDITQRAVRTSEVVRRREIPRSGLQGTPGIFVDPGRIPEFRGGDRREVQRPAVVRLHLQARVDRGHR